jgi:hypothetical protein
VLYGTSRAEKLGAPVTLVIVEPRCGPMAAAALNGEEVPSRACLYKLVEMKPGFIAAAVAAQTGRQLGKQNGNRSRLPAGVASAEGRSIRRTHSEVDRSNRKFCLDLERN